LRSDFSARKRFLYNPFFYAIYTLSIVTAIQLQCASGLSEMYTVKGNEPKHCEVLGIENRLDDKRWQDVRIGLGIQALLGEELYNTGCFKMIENSPEMLKKRQEIATGMWSGMYKGKDLPHLITQSEGDFIAWATLIYYGRRQSEMSAGIIHRNTDAVIVKIQITLQEKNTGKKWSAIGEGESARTGSSILFTFQGDKAELDQSIVGNAVREAIKNAVIKIVKPANSPA